MTPTPYVLPVELIYRELARSKPEETKPTSIAEVEPLNRDDVTAIIARKRAATPEELQDIISRAKELELTTGEREQIALDLSIFSAQLARQANGKREDPSSRLIYYLGYAITPFGLLPELAWYQNELHAGTKAVAACRRHQPPQCSCWRSSRESLYSILESFGQRSPESWAALRIWEALEEIELSSRPRGWLDEDNSLANIQRA
jgi:hypothetical protein